MSELLDVLDGHGNAIGVTKTKAQLIHDGNWRKVVHVWVVGGQGVLIQKRAETVPTFSGLLDISVGGSVRSGEDSRVAAVRELQEELGITCASEELEYLGTWKLEPKLVPESDGGHAMYDNDFSDSFLLRRDVDVHSLTLQAEEVAGVRMMTLDQLRDDISDPSAYAQWVPYGIKYYIGVADAIAKLV